MEQIPLIYKSRRKRVFRNICPEKIRLDAVKSLEEYNRKHTYLYKQELLRHPFS